VKATTFTARNVGLKPQFNVKWSFKVIYFGVSDGKPVKDSISGYYNYIALFQRYVTKTLKIAVFDHPTCI